MLFGYPIQATAENWLHEVLIEAIGRIHEALTLNEDLPHWPDFLPSSQRARLRRRRKLRDAFLKYYEAAKLLTQQDRDVLAQAIAQQNAIESLLNTTSNCAKLENLPPPIHEPVIALFEIAFDLLGEYEIRDRQYRTIYATLGNRVCPFCGLELLSAPGGPREDMDHYLYRSSYPFAAANLRNLVPMGHSCNSDYKRATDILWSDSGQRRQAIDPYNHNGVTVSLANTTLPADGVVEFSPEWRVDFDPPTDAVETWACVFQIRSRYVRDVLKPSYQDWLEAFSEWFRITHAEQQPSDDLVLLAMGRYLEVLATMELGGHEFLRIPFFGLLRQKCVDGNQRLLALLKYLISAETLPA